MTEVKPNTFLEAKKVLTSQPLKFGDPIQIAAVHFIELYEEVKELLDAAGGAKCPFCRGKGSSICDECYGSGESTDPESNDGDECEECLGEGRLDCEECEGTGGIEPEDLEEKSLWLLTSLLESLRGDAA